MDKKLIKIYEAFSERLQKHQLPHWNDLPEIDLYMDQVIVLTEKYLKDLTIDDDLLVKGLDILKDVMEKTK